LSHHSLPFRPGVMGFENPDAPDQDMGKNSYLLPKIRRSFEHSYQLLTVALNDSKQSTYLGYMIRGDDTILFNRLSRK
jgi:hypothetical protein